MAKDQVLKGSEVAEHFRNHPNMIYYTQTSDGPAEVHNRNGNWEIAGNKFPVKELVEVIAFDPRSEKHLD